MPKLCSRFVSLGLPFALLITFANETMGAELIVKIRSPNNGAQIAQEQAYVLVGGKVAIETGRSGYVDIFLVLDVSGSTAQYAGADFAEFSQLPNFYVNRNRLGGMGLPCAGRDRPGPLNLRNSILAAEIVASRRLLSQLNPETTRVGVITFGEEVWLRQRLTHDFDEVRNALDLIYKRGPYGGTNMVDAIAVAKDELLGKGESEKYLDSIKALIFFTDGFPTRPTADCSSADADLAINAARLAGKAGINIHVFALGEEALSNPRAAVGIAKESGGTYTAVTRPADVLAVVNKVSAVGVESIQVTNETLHQNALRSRLAADGFFASAVPVVEGLNRIQVLGRASEGSLARDIVTVNYQAGAKRSLDLEIFLEREKNLRLEIDRLGKSPQQLQREIEAGRQEGLKKSSGPFPAADNNSERK
jgi:von Willebrand factor type A domain-containing protein